MFVSTYRSEKKTDEVDKEKEAEKMAQFEALPEWKKKILLQKRKD